MINIDKEFLKTLMTLASGTAYQYGRDGVFKDDDIDNTNFHRWQNDYINSLIIAAGVREFE